MEEVNRCSRSKDPNDHVHGTDDLDPDTLAAFRALDEREKQIKDESLYESGPLTSCVQPRNAIPQLRAPSEDDVRCMLGQSFVHALVKNLPVPIDIRDQKYNQAIAENVCALADALATECVKRFKSGKLSYFPPVG